MYPVYTREHVHMQMQASPPMSDLQACLVCSSLASDGHTGSYTAHCTFPQLMRMENSLHECDVIRRFSSRLRLIFIKVITVKPADL